MGLCRGWTSWPSSKRGLLAVDGASGRGQGRTYTPAKVESSWQLLVGRILRELVEGLVQW